MDLDLQKINDVLSVEDNPINKMLIFRLTLKLVRIDEIEEEFSINLVKKRLYSLREKYFFVVKNNLLSDDLRDEIDKHYIILKDAKDNFKNNNEELIYIIKKELTYLECLLDLNITFSITGKDLLNELTNKHSLKREKE